MFFVYISSEIRRWRAKGRFLCVQWSMVPIAHEWEKEQTLDDGECKTSITNCMFGVFTLSRYLSALKYKGFVWIFIVWFKGWSLIELLLKLC